MHCQLWLNAALFDSCEELKQLFWEELTEMHPEIEFGSPVEVPEIMPQAAEAQLI